LTIPFVSLQVVAVEVIILARLSFLPVFSVLAPRFYEFFFFYVGSLCEVFVQRFLAPCSRWSASVVQCSICPIQ
jgi:hypothetical protein